VNVQSYDRVAESEVKYPTSTPTFIKFSTPGFVIYLSQTFARLLCEAGVRSLADNKQKLLVRFHVVHDTSQNRMSHDFNNFILDVVRGPTFFFANTLLP